jgi:hypothetical protein
MTPVRSSALLLLILGLIALPGCVSHAAPEPPPPKFSLGFWFWNGSSALNPPPVSVPDVLYVEVGSIREDPRSSTKPGWVVWSSLPEELPAAREYWLVFRCESRRVPDAGFAAELAKGVPSLAAEAARRNLPVRGVQLDMDSPTGSLEKYANLLHDFKKRLPPGYELSITALPDWFRDGTAIDRVVAEIDEFVPQFYDMGKPASPPDEPVIAKRLDPAIWRDHFNGFRKRYRIGISTFGRAAVQGQDMGGRVAIPNITPFDMTLNPNFQRHVATSQAGETVLEYRATQPTSLSFLQIAAGDSVQFVLPTVEQVRAATEGFAPCAVIVRVSCSSAGLRSTRPCLFHPTRF